MDNNLNVTDAKTRLISELSRITGFKQLKSGVLKKTINDITFEIIFFSSKWNASGQSIKINAEFRLIYKNFGKSPVNNVVASMFFKPDEGYWYDITTERKLFEIIDVLMKNIQETVLDLVSRFENDYYAAVQYLLIEGFEIYNVHLDFIADKLGHEAVKNKAKDIYAELSDEIKAQVIQYQNGARNKYWMINRCNLKYIVDNNMGQ